jgi:ferritin
MKIYDFILQRDGKVVLTKIETPKASWKSPLEVFQETLKHERHISACIDNIFTLANQEKDHATSNFFQWFVSEQVEEEANATSILEKVKLVGDNKSGLFMLDREMGQRQ